MLLFKVWVTKSYADPKKYSPDLGGSQPDTRSTKRMDSGLERKASRLGPLPVGGRGYPKTSPEESAGVF